MVALTPTLAAALGDLPPGPGSLRVEKAVNGPGEGPFGFHVFCPGGDAPLLDEEFELDAGDSKTFEGLPEGTECTVEEIDDGGAASTEITPSDGTAVIPADDVAVVAFLNVFPAVTTTSATTTSTAPATTTTTAAPVTTTTLGPSVLGEVLVAPELPRTGSEPELLGLAGFALAAFGLALSALMARARARGPASGGRSVR
jgi:hypothetical protein